MFIVVALALPGSGLFSILAAEKSTNLLKHRCDNISSARVCASGCERVKNMSGQTYLSLKKEFLDKNSKEAEAESISNMGEEDGKGYLIFNFDESNVEIEEIDESKSQLSVRSTTDLGDIYLTVELTVDSLISLIEVATKKLNKVKTVLEAVK